MKALLSVSDKNGIVDLAKGLVEHGYEILSTGGTAKLLKENTIPVTLVEEYTDSPEILGGRVKTLHPKIHGGILAKRGEHDEELAQQGIDPIDLVVVNLYPFQQTIAQDPTLEEAVEQIDIGGVTLLRAAAKNFAHVTVVCDPEDYPDVVADVSQEKRAELAVKAFAHTAVYDTIINRYLNKELLGKRAFYINFQEPIPLRYGENPHQKATFYPDGTGGIGGAEQLHGKQLSYNNYLDGDAAWSVVNDLGSTSVCVVKHLNPCGIATGATPKEALEAAWGGDIVSAFGSVIAFSQNVTIDAAKFLKDKFVEMVIAPGYDDDALQFLQEKSKNLRILVAQPPEVATQYRQVSGGMLEQSPDDVLCAEWECVTQADFPPEKKTLAEFTMTACKHTKSNAVILGIEYAPGMYKVLGMGAGQPNRVDSLKKLAVPKAQENIDREGGALSECVLASDAFFPFDDTVRAAAAQGIRYIVQPGGSIRDKEVVAACDELGVAMICTGTRHFNH